MSEFAKTIIGPLIAAAFVVVGIWLKERFERREAAQEWYEQYYITEGIDQFISQLLNARAKLNSIKNDVFLFQGTTPLTNREPLAKLEALFGDEEFLLALDLFESILHHIKDYEKAGPLQKAWFDELLELASDLITEFIQLRKAMLEVKITFKKDIYSLPTKAPVSKVLDRIRQRMKKTIEAISALGKVSAGAAKNQN